MDCWESESDSDNDNDCGWGHLSVSDIDSDDDFGYSFYKCICGRKVPPPKNLSNAENDWEISEWRCHECRLRRPGLHNPNHSNVDSARNRRKQKYKSHSIMPAIQAVFDILACDKKLCKMAGIRTRVINNRVVVSCPGLGIHSTLDILHNTVIRILSICWHTIIRGYRPSHLRQYSSYVKLKGKRVYNDLSKRWRGHRLKEEVRIYELLSLSLKDSLTFGMEYLVKWVLAIRDPPVCPDRCLWFLEVTANDVLYQQSGGGGWCGGLRGYFNDCYF